MIRLPAMPWSASRRGCRSQQAARTWGDRRRRRQADAAASDAAAAERRESARCYQRPCTVRGHNTAARALGRTIRGVSSGEERSKPEVAASDAVKLTEAP
jgi:hypothetical protein